VPKPTDLRIPFSWEERRPVLLDRLLYVPPHYSQHETWNPIPWSDPQIFGNDHLVLLEYCSGNGQWIAEKAKKFPHLNWVAVEKKFERARKIWGKLKREGISNLYVCCGEAAILSKFYIPGKSISEIFVNFPDPWPKLRHAKHRLIQAPFLQLMAKCAKQEAKATFVTDDPPYAKQMIKEIEKSSLWKFLLPSPHYSLERGEYGSSYFLDLWQKKGHLIHFIYATYIPALPL